MSVADGIRKFGFRRWYERQLIEAHAYLVTAFLGVIMIAACLDQFHWRDAGVKPVIMLGLVISGIVLCFKSGRAYFTMLFRAEHYAQQSVCRQCNAYGGLHVLGVQQGGYASGTDDWVRVRCRKCGNDWAISDMPLEMNSKKLL